MPNLVGIGLSQVPTNSMLGGMAYQDPEHASIKDLDLKNLSQINSEIVDTAVDVFIYDTSKDSDGGAWRKRTTHTSWYNETLGTATRGTRREFPAVAVIVAEQNSIKIYDGDDPNLPMWMVFTSGDAPGYAGPYLNIASGSTLSAVAALNGEIAVSCNGGSFPFGSVQINFLKDRSLIRPDVGGKESITGIAKRNETGSYGSSYPYTALVNKFANDVAMTVLPNAPIDSATGLPVPTIAVGTQGGTSVIRDDGNVYDYTSFAPGEKVQIDSQYVYVATRSGSNDYFHKSKILSSDESYSASITAGSGGFYMNSIADGGVPRFQSMTITDTALAKDQTIIRSGTNGIEIFDGNVDTISNVSAIMPFAFITSTYNTGYMVGDIKGAFLSDTDTTNKTNGQTDPDRSVNNNGLQVFGTINKSAVATGAELVNYHGFTSSNYLRHTNTINYGNAATITMGGWSKIPGSAVDANYNYLCSCRSGTTQIGLAIHIDNGGANSGKPYFYDVTNGSLQSTGPRVDDNQWHHIIGVLDGTSKKIYIDGELIESATVTGVNLSAVDITNVGHYVPSNSDTPNYSHGGYLALIKFSASAPSAEQIKKIYEDEKFLFQENAACTLYGSSDAVTALAYDEVTEQLHVGTSSGRSDFQGLRRINNTTTAVTTAISVHDEFIAEQ